MKLKTPHKSSAPGHLSRGASLSLVLLLLFVAGLLSSCASSKKKMAEDDPKPAPELTAEQRKLELESFDAVWTTIRDKHWDPDLNGIDWDGVKMELRPEMEVVKNADESRAILGRMIARLEQSHFGIVPRDVYEEEEEEDSTPDGENETSKAKETGGSGEAGLEVRILDGHAVVTEVWDDYPAKEHGVMPGFIVSRVGSWDVQKAIDRWEKGNSGSSSEDAKKTAKRSWFLSRRVEGRLSRSVGKKVMVTFIDGNDDKKEINLPMKAKRGKEVRFGNMPSLYLWKSSKEISDDIGSFRFNTFMDPMALMPWVATTMGSFKEKDGIIIDLRGNPGGIGALAMGVAGWFTEKKSQKLGTMTTRVSSMKFVVNPRPRAFSGALAILTDEHTGSTSEIFAGGMQDLERARVFGQRSMGVALPSVFERLPNGDGFQYAIANYISEGGKPLEELGVTPDEVVVPTRRELLDGRDPVVEAAVDWIRSRDGS